MPSEHRLLSGEVIRLDELESREKEFLDNLRKMARQDISYFEISRTAIGPGSIALGGRNRVNRSILKSPLYLVARDIATRAGIDQGLILAPEHESERDKLPQDFTMISVEQAANLIGISRAAVYKAIEKGKLRYRKLGNVTVVDRASAREYRDSRSVDQPSDVMPSKEDRPSKKVEQLEYVSPELVNKKSRPASAKQSMRASTRTTSSKAAAKER